MGDFNKSEYNKQYTLNNMKQIKLSVQKDEFDLFNTYCTKINVQKAAYLKNLVNTDAIARGYDPIFASDRRRKQGTDNGDQNNK